MDCPEESRHGLKVLDDGGFEERFRVRALLKASALT